MFQVLNGIIKHGSLVRLARVGYEGLQRLHLLVDLAPPPLLGEVVHLGGAAPLAARARRPRGIRLRRPQRVLALADGGHALVTHDQIQLLLRVHHSTGCGSTSTPAAATHGTAARRLQSQPSSRDARVSSTKRQPRSARGPRRRRVVVAALHRS